MNDYRVTYLKKTSEGRKETGHISIYNTTTKKGNLLNCYEEAFNLFKDSHEGVIVTDIKASFTASGNMAEFIFTYIRPQEIKEHALNIVEDTIEDAIKYFNAMMQEVEVISVVREDEEH